MGWHSQHKARTDQGTKQHLVSKPDLTLVTQASLVQRFDPASCAVNLARSNGLNSDLCIGQELMQLSLCPIIKAPPPQHKSKSLELPGHAHFLLPLGIRNGGGGGS